MSLPFTPDQPIDDDYEETNGLSEQELNDLEHDDYFRAADDLEDLEPRIEY